MLNNFQATDFTEFLGPWLTTGPNAFEPGDIPPGRAIQAQNVEYKPGQVRKRYGFSPVDHLANPLGDKILSMENWLTPVIGQPVTSYLAYLADSGSTHAGVNIANLATGVVTTLFTPAAASQGAVFQAAGTRLYIATYDSTINGSDVGHVYDNATFATDTLFQPPFSALGITFADGGASAALGVTPGPHNFGVLLQTRNGYTGAASPVNGSGAFTPIETTVTASGDALQLSITGSPWPTDVEGIFVIMTTADNLAQYYVVPGVAAAVPGGSTFTVNVLVDIDDGTLAATGQDATPFFSLFSGTLKPIFIAEYKNRLVYIGKDGAGVWTTFISDPDNFQAISLARSVLYLPGQRPATCTFTLYGNLYMVGPHWTYQTYDNGGDPVTWSRPQIVDAGVGTLSPNGVSVNASHGLAWVADVDGLYLFSGGSYQARPISYYQKSDWIRINWATGAGTVRVVDSKDTQRVHVLVPLDGATSPTHVMTWDYSRGFTPETVNYSLDSISGFSLGAIAIVQNDAKKHIEVWLGPYSASKGVLRQNDGTEANPYSDDAHLGISSVYETCLLPALSGGSVLHHVADHMRLQGAGTLHTTINTLDTGRSINLADITLATGPAQVYLRKYHCLSEAVSLKLTSSDPDAYFVFSALSHYSSVLLSNR